MSADLPDPIDLPAHGQDGARILDTMRALRDDDARWHDGRVFSLVFHPGDETAAFVREAYNLYFSENALNPSAFPSLRRMENEVVSMTASLLGNPHAVGNLTSGGTESILMAVKAAREWAREHRPKVREPEIVLPVTAHPAFDKAAHYFGVKLVHVPVERDTYRADVAATEKAVTRRTAMIVGSAPQYPQGVVDPITALAAIAENHGVLMHVDACVGGYMLPFVRELGYDVPPFDLSVPGVTSMSVDLHKYGYAAKGCSAILYNEPSLRKRQYFAYAGWPGGIYVSPTMTGTRPGGAIAAAWAVLHRLGREGYVDLARQVMHTVERLRDGIADIDGVRIAGSPHMSVMCIVGDGLDIYRVGDEMTARGWHLDRQQDPAGLHLTVNGAHLESVDAFLADLRASVQASQPELRDRLTRRARGLVLGAAGRVVPAPVLSRVTRAASRMMKIGEGDGVPKRSAAMYGMMASLPNKGDLAEVVIDALDAMTRRRPGDRRLLDEVDP